MSKSPILTSRTELYVVESNEANAQVFVSLACAMEEGKTRDFDDETDVTITVMKGPVDENAEARPVTVFYFISQDSTPQWKKENIK